MSERRIPETLRDKWMQEREDLYRLLWSIEDGITALIEGNVASYSIGNRSLTYQDLAELKTLRHETESRIAELEAQLSGRASRCVTTNVFLDPSIIVPRRFK